MSIQDLENDPGVFVCTECHSDQHFDPEKNIWVQDAGMPPPCRYCGGVVMYVMDKNNRQSAVKVRDRERGITEE